MVVYTFDGNWEEGSVFLPVFEDFDRFSKSRTQGIPLRYYDFRSLSPDPMPEQLESVNWLVQSENQSKVLAALLPYMRDVIYPAWKKHTLPEEYPDAYPDLKKIGDLRNLLSFGLITVQPNGLDGKSFVQYALSTPLDYEHGITIEMLDDRVVAWGEGLDAEYDLEYPDGYRVFWPPEFSSWEEEEQLRVGDLNWYKPDPKYNVLRPWQRYHNNNLPVKLIRAGMFDKLYGLLTAHPGMMAVGGNMIISAITRNDEQGEELVQFLLPKMESFHVSVLRSALNKERYDLLDQIIASGYDINGPLGQDALISAPLVTYYKAYENAQERLAPLRQIKWLIDNGLNPYLEEKFGRNAFFTLNRYHDKQRIQAIEREVDDLIAGGDPGPEPGSKPKPWWKRLF